MFQWSVSTHLLFAARGVYYLDGNINPASEVSQTLSGSGANSFSQWHHVASCTHQLAQLTPGLSCMMLCAIRIPHLIIHYFMRACPRKAILELWLVFLLLAFLLTSTMRLCFSGGLRVPGRDRGTKSLWRHYIPQIVGGFCACLDSSFTLLILRNVLNFSEGVCY